MAAAHIILSTSRRINYFVIIENGIVAGVTYIDDDTHWYYKYK